MTTTTVTTTPPTKEESAPRMYQHTINGLKVILRFGDMFKDSKQSDCTMIPYYHGGALLRMATELFGETATGCDNTAVKEAVEIFKNHFPPCHLVRGHASKLLFFTYDDAFSQNNPAIIFTNANRLLTESVGLSPTDSYTLRVPIYGTSNGVSHVDAALMIAYGIYEFACTHCEPFCPITAIEVVTLENETGAKDIARINQILTTLQQPCCAEKKNACLECKTRAVSTLFRGCGHACMCFPCTLTKIGRECTICARKFTAHSDVILVPSYEDVSALPCSHCGGHKLDIKKSMSQVFTPCGHANVLCTSPVCMTACLHAGKCPHCHQEATYVTTYYQ